MEEIFDQCFAGKTFKQTTDGQDHLVSFMGIDNIVMTVIGEAYLRWKVRVKSDSNRIIQEKNRRSWQMSDIHIQFRLYCQPRFWVKIIFFF